MPKKTKTRQELQSKLNSLSKGRIIPLFGLVLTTLVWVNGNYENPLLGGLMVILIATSVVMMIKYDCIYRQLLSLLLEPAPVVYPDKQAA